jgi:hypothetical protein
MSKLYAGKNAFFKVKVLITRNAGIILISIDINLYY